MGEVNTPDLTVQWLSQLLKGKKVAVLVSDGFEQPELDGPVLALRMAGATVEVLAEDAEHLGGIKGVWYLHRTQGAKGDKVISDVSADDYDLLLVPGGLASPDRMRTFETHLGFVRAFMAAGKPTAMICHGPLLLADAGMAAGRTLTSWHAIRKDLERAGATWVDQEVVRDGNLVTCRDEHDLPAFSRALIEMLARVPVAKQKVV